MKRLPLKSELLRAFLEGRKTVTRRLINPQPPGMAQLIELENWNFAFRDTDGCIETWIPKYLPGDIVGIGEPWNIGEVWNDLSGNDWIAQMRGGAIQYTDESLRSWVHYLNDGPACFKGRVRTGRVRTGRFLPDALVRHKARIVSVRAERLQEITEADASKEGVERLELSPSFVEHEGRKLPVHPMTSTYVDAFKAKWEEIHGKEAPWDSNPWVWRYEIGRVP